MDMVREFRRFNRFYTPLIGLLDQHLPDSNLTLAEGRVLYEIATSPGRSAADLARTLSVDKGQLSRIIQSLKRRRLLKSDVDPAHAKRQLLSLTPAGRTAFTRLDRGTRRQMASILKPLTDAERARLVGSMRDIQTTFGARTSSSSPVTLRSLAPGDIGWVIHRQAVLYAGEYGWDWTYEALVAKILGDFAASFDAKKEDGWVAERAGQIVGSVFLMRGDTPDVARLRLLYVEPRARGAGIGGRLVNTCIERARQMGYTRMTLWTNSILVSARRIYEGVGFRLVQENKHHSFGKDLVGQTWDLDL